MPIFLVRWQDLSAALVKASSEDELIYILDEVANPDACTWSVYRGPLFLEFLMPARFQVKNRERAGPIRPQDVVVEDVSQLYEDPLEVRMASGDTSYEMALAIEKKAFPHLYRVRHDRGEELTDEALRDAVSKELERLLQASWRHEQVKRRDDPDSRIAAEFDVPVRLVKRLRAEATRPSPKGGKPKRRR